MIIRAKIGNGKKDEKKVEASPSTALLPSSLSRESGKIQAVLDAELSHQLR